jgi:hypothetical protein
MSYALFACGGKRAATVFLFFENQDRRLALFPACGREGGRSARGGDDRVSEPGGHYRQSMASELAYRALKLFWHGTSIKKILDKSKQNTENISVPGVPGLFTCPGWDVGQWSESEFTELKNLAEFGQFSKFYKFRSRRSALGIEVDTGQADKACAA